MIQLARIRRRFSLARLFRVSLLAGLLLAAWSQPAGSHSAEVVPSNPEWQAIHAALQTALAAEGDQVVSYLIFTPALHRLALDGSRNWAAVYIELRDPQTGQVLPGEPGLAIAQREGQVWRVYLPTHPEWPELVTAAPEKLIPAETRQYWLAQARASLEQLPSETFTGYRLPWAGGTQLVLTQSISHPGASAYYAFDFAKGGAPSPMFNIHAAKSGRVHSFYDQYPTGNPDYGNFIILEDLSTTPVSYQLYLHLAKDSIPAGLKQIGAPVARGQFIGVADDTGLSTGNHLHFHVHLNPNSYWGTSVDVTFEDVAINGGRPRMVTEIGKCSDGTCSQGQNVYTSGNYLSDDMLPPGGDLITPAARLTLAGGALDLSGWAADNPGGTGLDYARLIARYGGAWHPVGPVFTASPFSYTWNLCADRVSPGPVSLALEARDRAGNYALPYPGLRELLFDGECPAVPPACSAAPGQVALFSEPAFGGGCIVLNAGSYTNPSSLSALGDNQAASLQVGSGVRVVLFTENNLQGRSETIYQDDLNLADNRLGAETLSSLLVQPADDPASAPQPAWPVDGAAFTSQQSLGLAGRDTGGAAAFQFEIDSAAQAWQPAPTLLLSPLSPGGHSWRVRARNAASAVSAWSAASSLAISAEETAPTQPAVSAPFTDDFETTPSPWAHSNNWDLNNVRNHTQGGAISWRYEPAASNGYDNGAPNAGDVTSPPISLPGPGYWLRFWYYTQIEGNGLHWDQRWVQISVDNGPFTNLLQLSDDPANTWLQSPAINLSAYAGAIVRVRFFFLTVDQRLNNFEGWYLDDFSITAQPPAGCPAGSEPDDTPALAAPLIYNTLTQAEICPGGDVDYFTFTGQAGDRVGAAASAAALGSPLDPFLFLLDSDGRSVLAENDDVLPGSLIDSALRLTLPHDGQYYLKLRAWNHPSAGGPQHSYQVSLGQGGSQPFAVQLSAPESGAAVPLTPFPIELHVLSPGAGVQRVDFYWHSADWPGSDWVYLGADWNGADGWSFNFDPATVVEGAGMAFYARASDLSGASRGAAAWDLVVDRTLPVSSLLPLSAAPSTVIHLTWTADDPLAGIAAFELQVQQNGNWQSAGPPLPGEARQALFVGQPGGTYGFRLRAIDRSGNAEAFPASAETQVTLPIMPCSAGDGYEPDNSAGQAAPASAGISVQARRFCNPARPDWRNDQDWLYFDLAAGETLTVHHLPGVSGAAAVLSLYSDDGQTLVAQAVPASLFDSTTITWRAATAQRLYLKIAALNDGVFGDAATYQLWIRQGQVLYLPAIHKR